MTKRSLRISLLTAAIVGSATFTHAQMVDCDIFLKGNYVEIGINSNGAYGTSVEAPTGYHANVLDTLYNDCTFMSPQVFQDLGFVADPNRTGWSSYYGDFIMPGNPREGWAMADATATATAYSYNYYTGSSGFNGPLTGANTAYTVTGSLLKGIWNGIFHSHLNVNQVTTIDTSKMYMMVHVGFYNTGTTPDTFYYMRTITPHNESVTHSSFSTRAKIEHQLPNPSGLVVVSARGTNDTLNYLAMGTRNPSAKCFIVKDSTLPGPGSLASIWAGDPAHYNYTDTLTGNHGIGIVYKFGLGAGDSMFLDFGYSFQGGIIDTVLDTSLHSGGGGGGGGTLHIAANTAEHITFYPNPATNELNISGLAANYQISIFDITGRLNSIHIAAADKQVTTLPISDLASGTYLIVVKDDKNNIIARNHFNKQ